MMRQPFALTPAEVRVLVRCPLHYHFLQQKPATQMDPTQAVLDKLVRETIQQLHAAGGPARLALEDCLKKIAHEPLAGSMIERYYHRLEQEWPHMMAGNETIRLKIFIAGVSLVLRGTIDRLDKTSDGGIVAILFRTESSPLPTTADLRHDLAITIYHALVAATYPLKRPIRIQELWLQLNQEATIELSEDEYRHNLGLLREPVQALARGEVMARPGLHCDICPFKYHGCPVYAHDTDAETEPDDFASSISDGKIPPRKWIFKI
jgi:RecB family exonuclease